METIPGNDDILIVQRILSGETDFFRVIVERYGSAITRFCRARLGSAEDAEDAAQDVFLRAYRSLGTFRLGKSFPSWLFMIAANRVKTRYSVREARQKLYDRAEAEFAVSLLETGGPDDAEKCALDALEAESIRAAVGLLAKEKRDVVELYYIAGLSVAEVAETLGVGMEAVKSRLWRSRKELALILSGATVREQGR